jgi:hypothetical protein
MVGAGMAGAIPIVSGSTLLGLLPSTRTALSFTYELLFAREILVANLAIVFRQGHHKIEQAVKHDLVLHEQDPF